jgi:hypothetical protein
MHKIRMLALSTRLGAVIASSSLVFLTSGSVAAQPLPRAHGEGTGAAAFGVVATGFLAGFVSDNKVDTARDENAGDDKSNGADEAQNGDQHEDKPDAEVKNANDGNDEQDESVADDANNDQGNGDADDDQGDDESATDDGEGDSSHDDEHESDGGGD